MADQFTETTTQGYGSRLVGSLIGVLIGFVFVPASIILLYWNEGREVAALQALDRGAKQVIELSADRLDPAADGKLVHLSGAMTTGAPARDPLFGVTGQGLVRLERSVEMYQWKEEEHTETHQAVGGSKTTETTYTYRKDWSPQAINSSAFKHPEDHLNPDMPVRGQTFESGEVKLGAYKLGGAVLSQISAFQPFAADSSIAPPDGWRREGDGFLHGAGRSANPAVGDVKVSFTAVEAQPISVVAGESAGALAAFHEDGGYTIAMARPGVASADEMFRAKKQEARTWTWILRGGGFVGMLAGFMLIARPISMVLAVLPFLEGIVEAGAFLIALTLAVPLALVTIAVAWFAHRPLIGGALLAAAIAAFVLFRKMHGGRAAAVPGAK